MLKFYYFNFLTAVENFVQQEYDKMKYCAILKKRKTLPKNGTPKGSKKFVMFVVKKLDINLLLNWMKGEEWRKNTGLTKDLNLKAQVFLKLLVINTVEKVNGEMSRKMVQVRYNDNTKTGKEIAHNYKVKFKQLENELEEERAKVTTFLELDEEIGHLKRTVDQHYDNTRRDLFVCLTLTESKISFLIEQLLQKNNFLQQEISTFESDREFLIEQLTLTKNESQQLNILAYGQNNDYIIKYKFNNYKATNNCFCLHNRHKIKFRNIEKVTGGEKKYANKHSKTITTKKKKRAKDPKEKGDQLGYSIKGIERKIKKQQNNTISKKKKKNF
ncbi:hypothetical protein RFI_17036 [Reticulomyxa filosa]|uniref:Uncharacterized protein n=1 Tax=Reticulomyxa filosa TaxID=46433 RepID=X6N1M7_RETFI|nr:hypothetical protein RFI_17036 [Reticulomyxa filosa]|eukprot:ETO20180.1 hypothetical protein RFI_17036 [Reticulomyxa filosa]